MGKQHGQLIREKRKAKKIAKKEKAWKVGNVEFKKTPRSSNTLVKALKTNPVAEVRERKGVQCVRAAEGVKVPKCPHGPCLLFSDGSKSWFSCAVYRKPDFCDYKVELDSEGRHQAEDATPLYYDYGYGQSRKLLAAHKKSKKALYWCGKCFGYVDLPHRDPVEGPLDEGDSNLIARLLKSANRNTGGEAFWFSGNVLNMLNKVLANFDSVLAIGCPTAADFLEKQGKRVFLLDYDHRLSNFYGPDQFAHFSMLANHFYESDGQLHLNKFFKKSIRLAVLCDPPFGAHVEALSRTLLHIQGECRKQNRAGEVVNIVFLPVFVGKHLHNFQQLDYKVTYVNHGPYKDPRKTTVRMFTDAKNLKQFAFPEDEGYKLCKPCQRYVSAENSHCKKCNECTTKVSVPAVCIMWLQFGPTYRHCDMCERCVKPGYHHCNTCHRCHLPNRCMK